MTRIELTTANQRLISQKKVLLASGDINSVELHVEFDHNWDDFPIRSATFYTSNNSTVQEILLIDNVCVVPSEVLMEKAVLYIGTRGFSASGEAIKTSSIVKYNIVQGATAGETTLNPSLDLYQQFLAAMTEGLDPVSQLIEERIRAAVNKRIDELSDTVNDNFAVGVRFPDYTNKIGVITAEMQPWTAPENCWVVSTGSVYVSIDGNYVSGTISSANNGAKPAVSIPVAKGSVVNAVDEYNNVPSFTAYRMKA